jgi:hypothetical protein
MTGTGRGLSHAPLIGLPQSYWHNKNRGATLQTLMIDTLGQLLTVVYLRYPTTMWD